MKVQLGNVKIGTGIMHHQLFLIPTIVINRERLIMQKYTMLSLVFLNIQFSVMFYTKIAATEHPDMAGKKGE